MLTYRVYVFQNDRIIEIHEFEELKDALEMNDYYNDDEHFYNQIGAMWRTHFERRKYNATL